MAAGSVNPFNLSDSEEEAERRPNVTTDTQRSPNGGASSGPPGNPFATPVDTEPPTLLLSSNRTSPSAEGLSVSAAATAAMTGGTGDTRVSIDAIAAQLLRDQYILTALELHTEMLEAGRELPRLRDYFSNPGNFERQSGTPPASKDQGLGPGGPLNRAGSISTLDSLDFARYSDDGNRETDERVTVLEFELRKAKETIQALRANLTQAAESELTSQERKKHKSSVEFQDPIRQLEKRALNFLVNEYLLRNEYKLAAITFSDENDDQDFELWDDVGLNIPKPPDLLQLYRNGGSVASSPRETVDVAVSMELGDLPGNYTSQEQSKKPDLLQQQQTELVQELEYQIGLLNTEKESLAEQIRKMHSEIQILKRCGSSPPSAPLDLGGCPTSGPSSTDSSDLPSTRPLDNGQYLDTRAGSTAEDSADPQPQTQSHGKLKSRGPVHFDQPNRKLSPAFQQALLSFCRMSSDSRLGAEVSRIADSEESVMLMLGRCLPHIVPNVLLAKREELIPLILCTACLHPEARERDQLLHILFNLIKRPDDEQRQMILTGCVAFARHVGPTRVEAELLPQCWEQINHKYPERRLLVAESCGALAPYLPKEIRSSLVLSMLQQMLAEDKADMVREAVVKSLGIIMAYIDDPDKYSQGLELMLLSLADPSERVVSATHQVFIPAFAAWTTELGILHTTLIPSLLTRIEKLLLVGGEHGLDEHKLHMYLSALQSLIPPLFAVVLQNAPFTSRAKLHGDVPAIEVTRFPRPASPLQDVATIVGSRETVSVLLSLYDHQLEHEGTTGWDSLLWVVNQLLPQLIEILILRGMSEALVDRRAAPALITLCSGPEFSVRISTIPAFGTIMETVTQKELLERVKMQLESFLEDPQYQDQHSLHMEIIRTFGRVGPNAEPRFRDEFVLPHLHKLALGNNSQTVETKRIDIATQLFEAYSALSCCFISEEVMVNHFLPGLRCLRADMEQLSAEHEVILSSMIRECEIKIENRSIGDAQGSLSIASSLVGEDAKTKFLSKMGQLTTSGAMLANVFQRKK
ncbi:unnamed protein product [Boreogadus saida]